MDILNMISSWLKTGIASVIDLLPDSPFHIEIPPMIQQLLGYLNYFIPIRAMLITLLAWTSCIVVYYISMVFLRWLKAIE